MEDAFVYEQIARRSIGLTYSALPYDDYFIKLCRVLHSYAIYLFILSIINRMATIRGVLLPQQVINTIVPCPDEFMVTKVAIKKSNEWRPEKEWRLFFTTDDNSVIREEHPHVIQKASAVYLGRKTSSINEKIIVDIAREKHIPVFKMTISNTSKTYRLGKKLIYKPL